MVWTSVVLNLPLVSCSCFTRGDYRTNTCGTECWTEFGFFVEWSCILQLCYSYLTYFWQNHAKYDCLVELDFLIPPFHRASSQHFRVQAEAFNIFWFFFWLKMVMYDADLTPERSALQCSFVHWWMISSKHTHTHSVPIMDHGSLTWSLIWPVCIKKVKSWHGTMKCFSDANTPI